jgi:hypothetical protein
VITEVDFGFGPLEIEPFEELDSYINTHVFEPAFYYVAVTCFDDFDFIGCPISPEPDPPPGTDFEYSLRRHCRSVASLDPIDCTPSGSSVSDELRSLTIRPGVEVDFYEFQATAGDWIEVDIDVTDPNSKLDSIVGLFQSTGPFLDGIQLTLDDEATCEIDTDACNDDDFAPGDTGGGVGDSYLPFCAPQTGTVVLGVSNAVDLDFNGLDDDFPADLEFIKEFIGTYDMTLRCTRPDADGDGITACLDNCPTVFNPGQDPTDTDSDGLPNDCDNCPTLPNVTQVDTEGDGVGDVCDICPYVDDPNQLDSDGDGIGDACQCGDVSGDGSTNFTDARLIFLGQVPAEDLKCDVNADGQCNFIDGRLVLLGQVPEQLCPAGQAP